MISIGGNGREKKNAFDLDLEFMDDEFGFEYDAQTDTVGYIGGWAFYCLNISGFLFCCFHIIFFSVPRYYP